MRRLLLDTHVVLWWLAGDRRLGASSRRLIERSSCNVSAVSLVEVAVKRAAGRVALLAQETIDARLQQDGVTLLSMTPRHVDAATRLLGRHHDMFDCLLVGTALAEQLTLLTRDAPLIEAAKPLLGELLVEA